MSAGGSGASPRFVVSCEHGGNEVPPRWAPLFRGAEDALESHRGWDPGVLGLARALADRLGAPLHQATVTRLLVDLNRSPGHPRVFSEVTRALSAAERAELLRLRHAPYREAVLRTVREGMEGGRTVLHLSVHSFTPVLDGRERRTDLALLYDPGRPAERRLADAWARALRARLPGRSVRRNHPYRGVSDGLTTWLRARMEGEAYLGMEIEVSQRWLEAGRFPDWVAEALLEGLSLALERTAFPGN